MEGLKKDYLINLLLPKTHPEIIVFYWQLLQRSHPRNGCMHTTPDNLCIWERKWLLKHRDYRAIQVSAGYGESKQLPHQLADVSAIQHSNTMHQYRDCSVCVAWSSFPREQAVRQPIWEASPLLLWSLLLQERRGRLQEWRLLLTDCGLLCWTIIKI